MAGVVDAVLVTVCVLGVGVWSLVTEAVLAIMNRHPGFVDRNGERR
jgi:arginine exporter protein ArgO